MTNDSRKPLIVAIGALGLPLASVLLTLSVWYWIVRHPQNSFHDQGEMIIVFACFPIAFGGWLFFAFLTSSLHRRISRDKLIADSIQHRATIWISTFLTLVGLIMSVLTLTVR